MAAKHKAKSKKQHTAERNARVDAMRERNMFRKYKKTWEDYFETLKKQGGGCAICHKPPVGVTSTGAPRRLSWDHDHSCCPGKETCGKCVRGLLCTDCNFIVGKIELGRFLPHEAYIKVWKR